MNARRNLFSSIMFTLAAVLLGAALAFSPAQADDYRSIPGAKYWNVSAPGANTDAITDITWGEEETCRVSVQVATSSVVNLMVQRGATEKALGLNSNIALTAGALYQFDVAGMELGDVVNFQVETDSVLDKIDVGALRSTR